MRNFDAQNLLARYLLEPAGEVLRVERAAACRELIEDAPVIK